MEKKITTILDTIDFLEGKLIIIIRMGKRQLELEQATL